MSTRTKNTETNNITTNTETKTKTNSNTTRTGHRYLTMLILGLVVAILSTACLPGSGGDALGSEAVDLGTVAVAADAVEVVEVGVGGDRHRDVAVVRGAAAERTDRPGQQAA